MEINEYKIWQKKIIYWLIGVIFSAKIMKINGIGKKLDYIGSLKKNLFISIFVGLTNNGQYIGIIV